jgi:glycosyltransferase involved in cell wall biosynthesis
LFLPGRDSFDGSIAVRLLPFLNVTPIKQVVLGLDVVFGLLHWAWRKRRNSRLVLTYNLSVPPGAFTLFAARLAGAKAVVSVNDINVPGETVPMTALFRLDFELQRWLLPRFDGHLVVADEIAHDFFPGRPYVRVEGGVDRTFLERTKPTGERTKGDGPLVLAFAGWLNEANGVSLILAALAIAQGRQLRVKIAGTGPLQASVEQAARQDPRVEFLGLLDPAGVANLYAEADVLLNIRLTKNMNTRYFFPSKLIEYLGSGVPTITTRVAHAETEFADLAYILSDESPKGLADLITFVGSQSPEERSQRGRRAREYVSTYKTWDAQAAKVAHYLHEVIEGGGNRAGRSHSGSREDRRV